MTLTRRQIEVLRALEDGSQKEAGAQLGITVPTVKNHLTAVYRKLGVNSLVEAYRQLGWLR